jgi:hypothetical protein
MRIMMLLVFSLATAQVSASAESVRRNAQPMFKGVELYSWQDSASHAWLFSLLPGTNRNKPLAEINGHQGSISGIRALKLRLAELVNGEEVFWGCPYPELSFPPDTTVGNIVGFAAAHGVHLSVRR